MKNPILFLLFWATTTTIFAQSANKKNRPTTENNTMRYVEQAGSSVGFVSQDNTIDPVSDEGGTDANTSSVVDSILPFLRITECNEQLLRYEWHLPAMPNNNNGLFIIRKNNVTISNYPVTPQMTSIGIPLTGLQNGDVIEAVLQRGLSLHLRAQFVTSLQNVSITGNAPMPMATVEIVHARRTRVQQRAIASNLSGQCLYVNDGEVTNAAYYRTADVASGLAGVTDLTDSIFSGIIANKTAYITYNYNYGSCNNNNDGSMHAENAVGLVYPNPSEEAFNIQYSADEPANVSVSVMDMQGREVFAAQKQNAEGTQQFTIDTLPKGIYIYVLHKNSETQRGTLVKN